jgi:Protein of unknown function (DUF3618)
MGENADQIEQQINRTRGDLTDNLHELQERAKGAFDWRNQFENRPGTMLAVAFGGGVLASALIPLVRRKPSFDRQRVRVSDRVNGRASENEEEREERVSAARNAGRRMAEKANIYANKSKKRSPALGALKGALVSLAASRLSSVISDLLAGYREELQRTRHDRRDFSHT